MKESYRISTDKMNALLASLGETYRICGPKRVGSYIRYGEIRALEELVWQEKSHFSPKEIFYPIVQTMLYFSEDEVQESKLEDNRDVILFLRPCDINGIRRLDTMFLENGGQADHFYQRRREKVKFFLMECQESFETCFCVSMGSSRTDQYGAAFRFGGEDVRLEVNPKDGEDALCHQLSRLLEGEERCDFTPEFVTENQREVAVPRITDRGLLKEIHGLPMWREFDDNCIGCGGCNTVCITCSCFDTTDVIYHETSRDGERRRAWSSCMLDSYSTMAGGHNVRAKAGDRMRFKAMHKTYDFQARFGEEHMCVGCGRCDMRCPKEIHFSETVDRLAHEVERLKRGEEAE